MLFTCSSCGAKMDIDNTRDVLYCPYCGTEHYLDSRQNIYYSTNTTNHKEYNINASRRRVNINQYNQPVETFGAAFVKMIGKVILWIIIAFVILSIFVIMHP